MSFSDDKPGKVLRVALLGCGVVGTQVARLLAEQADDLAVRTGARLEVAGIAVRRMSHPRPGVDPALLTTDAMGLATRPDVDIVIEVIGGVNTGKATIHEKDPFHGEFEAVAVTIQYLVNQIVPIRRVYLAFFN